MLVKSQEDILKSQDYALEYCRLDVFKGMRHWKNLSSEEHLEIDRQIFNRAIADDFDPFEAAQIIYYGSPYAQRQTHQQRFLYAIDFIGELFPCSKPEKSLQQLKIHLAHYENLSTIVESKVKSLLSQHIEKLNCLIQQKEAQN